MSTLEERFYSKVGPPTDSGCMEWQAYIGTHGYGMFSVENQPTTAHRVAYELAKGPIPVGWIIDHLCRNLPCVNPEHLEAVTYSENLIRGVRHLPSPDCPQGHPYAEFARYTKTGARWCWECNRIRNYQKYHARKNGGG